MISKWKYNYTDEEKCMSLTILNKNQEINKLVDELEEQERHIKEADIEIERLNNIINELEKWLKDYIKLFDKPDMLEEQTLEDLKEVLNKIQELKGSDKNE